MKKKVFITGGSRGIGEAAVRYFALKKNYDVTFTFYKNEEKDIYVEFSVYNKTFEKDVLQEHLYKTHLPLYISLMLMILKFCFYKLQIINRKTYIYYKKKILSLGIGLPEDKFVSY